MFDLVRTATPFAFVVMATLCIVIEFRAWEAQSKFGPNVHRGPNREDVSPLPPAARFLPRAATRVSTGLALGIVVGEALSFFFFPEWLL